MLQTQFCGSDYKFVISWNALNNENYNSQKIFESDENLFYKLDELYQNISKFSTGTRPFLNYKLYEIINGKYILIQYFSRIIYFIQFI